jgi:hypothetical protein
MTPTTPRAFFSYSREDSDFAQRLARDLRAVGAHVWLDQLDIHPGERWDRSVEDALAECSRILVILSPSAVDSTNVMDEVSFALEEKKTVIPVLYRDCKIPFRLRRLQYIDCRSDYERGLRGVLTILLGEEVVLELAQAAAAGSSPPAEDPGAAVAKMQQQERAAAEEARRRAEQEQRERAAAEAARRKAEREQQQRAAAQREASQPQVSSVTTGWLDSSARRYLAIGGVTAVALILGVWILVSRSSAPPEVGKQAPLHADTNPQRADLGSEPHQTTEQGAAKPSFNCQGLPPSRPIETLVCRDADLASREVAMVTVYKEMRLSLPEADRPALKDNQAAWLREYTRACTALAPAPGYDITAPGFRDCVERYLTSRAQDLRLWKPR